MSGAAAVSVLLVEDEVMISNLVADRLVESGFRVREVATADETLRYMRSGASIDVLFTDISLPGGMNGAELAERAREMRPEMPIVYVSGRYKLSEISPLVPRSLFVAKPYDPNDICALLTRLTGRGGAPA
ncbi:MAG TPA: response regulator [Pseudolabrys sp.]|jgi:CheY-like chemotaxis protein|nr:response regulator [Pseudolabrys sp.]